jgi:hypothetical protein
MKRIVGVIFFSSFSIIAMSQGRFKIEPSLSIHVPMLPSSINLGGHVYNELSPALVSMRSESIGSGVNRSVGFMGEIPVTKKFSIRLGAAYAPKDFVGHRTEPCSCDSRTAEEPIIFKQRYVDVPLSMRFYLSAKRWIVFAEAGAIVNILVRNKTQYVAWGYASKWYVSDIHGITLNEYMVGVNGGIGAGYSLHKRLDVILTTSYRQVVTEYTATDDYRPRAIVATLGLAIKFGKEQTE